MKDLKELHIVFENCDVAVIPRHLISALFMEDVTESYSLYSTLYKSRKARECFIRLNWDECRKLIVDAFNQHTLDYYINDESKCITHYDLIFEDGTSDYICVPWESEDDYFNTAEHHEKTSNDGIVELLIIEHKNVNNEK